jgi:hypothetical protein
MDHRSRRPERAVAFQREQAIRRLRAACQDGRVTAAQRATTIGRLARVITVRGYALPGDVRVRRERSR